ncbi:MAG: universal stress protein [Chlorobiaceae bacterium]|nr:universal stress protein [Chlorobiaceae bacterium]
MLLYREILVAIDCSEVDAIIIKHVSALALQLGATLHLLHVVHSHTLDQDRYLREHSLAMLEGYRNKLQADGVETHIVIRSGEPENEILCEIKENVYDLLAMATHGHRLPGRIVFGSVSRTLRQKITIPLLLIQPEH